jgi:hypothetical protein
MSGGMKTDVASPITGRRELAWADSRWRQWTRPACGFPSRRCPAVETRLSAFDLYGSWELESPWAHGKARKRGLSSLLVYAPPKMAVAPVSERAAACGGRSYALVPALSRWSLDSPFHTRCQA